WELLVTPLLLNVVTVSYAGRTAAEVPISGTMAERRDHLFGLYVNQMLRRRTAERRYTPEQTVHWLSWLASQMAKYGQTVFYIERLQLDWLPNRPRWVIHLCNALVGGLGFGLVWGLVLGLFYGLAIGLFDGLTYGLIRGLFDGLVGLVLGLAVGLVV